MSVVLVVDDKQEHRYLLEQLLTSHGHDVRAAVNGEEALAIARSNRPDLVVSDLLMPVMDGYALLRALRVDPGLSQVPFVVYTATYTAPEDERLALDLGADAFLLKPTEPDELMRRLKAIMGDAQQRARSPVRAKGDGETQVLQAYSEVLVRKLEEKTLQLEQRTAELEISNAQLQEGIAERERIAEILRRTVEVEQQANIELRAVELMRGRFLTAVSHELRTPLTSVLGLAESLKQYNDNLDSSTRAHLTGRLVANARRLAGLLEDLLDLNRLSAGKGQVDLRRCDLSSIINAALDDVDLEDRAVTVDVDDVTFDADQAQLVRVVANLLRNAGIHTPPGTPIELMAGADGQQVMIRLVDHGDGVPAELRERIFEPFEQGPSAPKHQPGTGIGLSLVREFVALHGGTVGVEDTPGGGATFIVQLPLVALDVQPG